MSLNHFEKKEEQAYNSRSRNRQERGNSLLKGMIDGTILTNKGVVKSIPFILFLALLATLYIGNHYWAISQIQNIENMKKELKELRTEHIAAKSRLMHKSKQSEVAKRLSPLGFVELTEPPKKIIIKNNK